MSHVINNVFPTEDFEFFCPSCRHEWNGLLPAGVKQTNVVCKECGHIERDVLIPREEGPQGAA